MIAELLSRGKDNARTGKELCDILSITARELTAAVERERRDGNPICASTSNKPGYFLAANRDEMQLYCASLHRRAAEIQKTRSACLSVLESLPEV